MRLLGKTQSAKSAKEQGRLIEKRENKKKYLNVITQIKVILTQLGISAWKNYP